MLGCRVDALGPAAAVARIVALAQGAAPSLVVTFGTEMAVYAQRDPAFRRIVNDSALSLCDTVGVLWAARMQGVQLGERVAGVVAAAGTDAPLAVVGDSFEKPGIVIGILLFAGTIAVTYRYARQVCRVG